MKTIYLSELLDLLRAHVRQAGGVRPAGRSLGLSASYISGLLHDKQRRPGPLLLDALGFEEIVMYRKVK